MENFMSWIAGLELSTGHVIGIVIFFLYILSSCVIFAITFAAGRGYLDLAKGLRRILERQEQAGEIENILELAEEISKYYDSYGKLNPAVNQRYAGIISWMNDILLQTNMFTDSTRGRKKKFGIWFDEYYDTLMLVQQHFEKRYPFYRCSSSQAQILEDISGLENVENRIAVENLVKKTEAEFIRLNNEGKKNERSNYVSIAIGIAGILVSVLLTVLQMF